MEGKEGYVKIAAREEIPEDEGRTFVVGEERIAVFDVQGTLYAIEDTCMHRGGSLGKGELDGPVVTCPRHGWEWDVTTGELVFKRKFALARYSVREEEGSVFVDPRPLSAPS